MHSITDFTFLIFDFIKNFFNILNSHCSFTLFGYNVGLGHFLIALLLTSIIISIFWKGGRA